jgi:hypothetical protein
VSLYESFRVNADQLAHAARVMAWREGIDGEILEGLVRKVERSARHTMFRGFLAEASNDTDPIG